MGEDARDADRLLPVADPGGEQILRLVEQQQRVPAAGELLRQPQPGEPILARGFAPLLVRLRDGAQGRADAGGERRGEAGLAGAGRP